MTDIRASILSESKEHTFRESDYHTPRNGKRKRAILERNSTACLCMIFSIVAVIIIMLSVALGLRFTGTRDVLSYTVTLGDTQLITFNSFFCQGVYLESNMRSADMYVTGKYPPLSGRSDIFLSASFQITDYTEYVDYYGWYDFGEIYYNKEIDYVTWNFRLYKGSVIELTACLTSQGNGDAKFFLVKGRRKYSLWKDNPNKYSEGHYTINPCFGLIDKFMYEVNDSDEFYFVFYASEGQPKVNISLYLNRTEYSVDDANPSCTAEHNKPCCIDIPLHQYQYAVIITNNTSTDDIKYGDEINLIWKCISRDWIYVIMFFIPVLFLGTLFIAMYFVFRKFNNRKLNSYEVLGVNRNITDNCRTKQAKLVYDEAPCNTAVNLLI